VVALGSLQIALSIVSIFPTSNYARVTSKHTFTRRFLQLVHPLRVLVWNLREFPIAKGQLNVNGGRVVLLQDHRYGTPGGGGRRGCFLALLSKYSYVDFPISINASCRSEPVAGTRHTQTGEAIRGGE
jgi:hypothetical protein